MLTLRTRFSFLPLAAAWSVCPAQPLDSDPFNSPDGWRMITSDGVRLQIAADPGPRGEALRLDYEFVTGAGFCLIQRDCAMPLPDNFEFALRVRGEGPANNLEFKLLDAAGDSVWWVNRRAFEWPRDWTRLSNKKRRFEFAWGPSGGAPLTAISKIEFAIASNSGGKGSVWLDDLTFRELPAKRDTTGKALVAASSSTDGAHAPLLAHDGDETTSWRCDAGASEQWISLSPPAGAEFGGVVAEWEPGAAPLQARLETSDDGVLWTALAPARDVWSDRSVFITPDAESRHVRLVVRGRAQHPQVGLREMMVREPDFGATPNAAIASIAKASPKGRFPRHFLQQQCYWTILGADGDDIEALLNEDGALEVGKRGFTIEPFVLTGETALSWADGSHAQSLQNGRLPIPTVTRRHPTLDLEISPFVDGTPDQSTLIATYRLRNTGADMLNARLALAVRPFQVNPSWQRLNFEGGVSPIRTITPLKEQGGLVINERARVLALTPGASIYTSTFDGGDIAERLASGIALSTGDVADGQDLASGALLFDLALAPGESREVVLACPLGSAANFVLPDSTDAAAWAAEKRAAVSALWQEKVSRVSLNLPAADQWIADTFHSQIACILINRDGPAIQPGSRSYERSWARDGSMTSAALLECGHPEEVRAWIDWFGSRIFESGKVPCVVDRRGPDPVPEHDSHGQYIWAVANYYRHTRDAGFLSDHWPRVQRVVAYIQSLRSQRMTPEYLADDTKRAFYGLVPESISHEGYSAKPMHSYWDDFFVLLGLKEAAYLASAAGDEPRARDYAKLAAEFRACLYDSIQRTQLARKINYIPGCVELGDFDSTSTTISLFPCDELAHAPRESLQNTFERYWEFFDARRRPDSAWDAYTPYEIRHVGAFIRLGQPERAYELLKWFRTHQRPQGWNHWAEVVWNDPHAPRFIGDMPHTWVGSDYLNAVRSIFIYEQGDALVAFAGVPGDWIVSGEPIAASGFVTQYGTFDGSLRRAGNEVRARIAGTLKLPPGGIIVPAPPGCLGEAVIVRSLPAEVSFQTVR
ncbi:hypothetical protein PHYC_00589 [Phycisphaerales bacterium]|nr:hypothetical protein PHYC_00589 [Phycisphaerales bacterium]